MRRPEKLEVKVLRFLLCLVLLVVVPQSASAEGHTGYKTPAYMAGVEAYRQGHYTDAVRYFNSAIRQEVGNANAHYYLALTLDQLGEAGKAAQEYEYVVNQGREPGIVQFALGRLNSLTREGSRTDQPVPSSLSTLLKQREADQGVVFSNGQVAVPLKNNQNALMVDALLTQEKYSSSGAFIIDTGATYTSISQQMAEKLGMDLQHCEKVLITTANGRIEVPKITIDRLNVNGLEARNVEATVIPVRHGSSFSGLLGLSFIRQFVVTIDPQAGHLIFRKN